MLHWAGGAHTEHRLPKRRRGQRNSAPESIVEAVRILALIAKGDFITAFLNRNGLKTGNGNRWTRSRVTSFRTTYKIPVFRRAEPGQEPWLNLRDAAALIGVAARTLRIAAERGKINSLHPLSDGPVWFAGSVSVPTGCRPRDDPHAREDLSSAPIPTRPAWCLWSADCGSPGCRSTSSTGSPACSCDRSRSASAAHALVGPRSLIKGGKSFRWSPLAAQGARRPQSASNDQRSEPWIDWLSLMGISALVSVPEARRGGLVTRSTAVYGHRWDSKQFRWPFWRVTLAWPDVPAAVAGTGSRLQDALWCEAPRLPFGTSQNRSYGLGAGYPLWM